MKEVSPVEQSAFTALHLVASPLFSVSKAVDHAMHPSEMYMLPLILGGLLFPKSNTNIGLPSLTDYNPTALHGLGATYPKNMHMEAVNS